MAKSDSTLIGSFLNYKRVERQSSPNTLDAYGRDLREFCACLKRKQPTAAQESDG